MVKVKDLPCISKVIVKNHIDVAIKIVVECSVCIIAVFVAVGTRVRHTSGIILPSYGYNALMQHFIVWEVKNIFHLF